MGEAMHWSLLPLPYGTKAVCGEPLTQHRCVSSDTTLTTCTACKRQALWKLVATGQEKKAAETMKPKAQLAKEMRDTANKLLAEAADLERQAKRENPAEPQRNAGNNFKVNVRFVLRGKLYSYLLLRTGLGGRWYTTGTHDDQKVFENWEALVAWLRGPDIAQHGAVIRLIDSISPLAHGYTGPNTWSIED